MPRVIASNRIPRVSIGNRQIAIPPAGGASGGYGANFPPGAWTFLVPFNGVYRWVLWGGGGNCNNGSGVGASSAAFIQADRRLIAGTSIAVTCGSRGGSPSIVNIPGGSLMTAGPGDQSGVAGVPTITAPLSSDIMLPGTTGTVSVGQSAPGLGSGGGVGPTHASQLTGAGAPGVLPWRGGRGGGAQGQAEGLQPGAGGGQNASNGQQGGDGCVFVFLIG
jgi:hypothetical protein